MAHPAVISFRAKHAMSGDVLLDGARNCYVRSDGMLAAVQG